MVHKQNIPEKELGLRKLFSTPIHKDIGGNIQVVPINPSLDELIPAPTNVDHVVIASVFASVIASECVLHLFLSEQRIDVDIQLAANSFNAPILFLDFLPAIGLDFADHRIRIFQFGGLQFFNLLGFLCHRAVGGSNKGENDHRCRPGRSIFRCAESIDWLSEYGTQNSHLSRHCLFTPVITLPIGFDG